MKTNKEEGKIAKVIKLIICGILGYVIFFSIGISTYYMGDRTPTPEEIAISNTINDNIQQHYQENMNQCMDQLGLYYVPQ